VKHCNPSPRCRPRMLLLQRWRGRRHVTTRQGSCGHRLEAHGHASSPAPARPGRMQSRACASSMLRRFGLSCAADWRKRLRRSAALSMPVCARAGAWRGQACWQGPEPGLARSEGARGDRRTRFEPWRPGLPGAGCAALAGSTHAAAQTSPEPAGADALCEAREATLP